MFFLILRRRYRSAQNDSVEILRQAQDDMIFHVERNAVKSKHFFSTRQLGEFKGLWVEDAGDCTLKTDCYR